ncbi:MAG: hypothetical protein EOO00_05070 [Chitinophagaceae bacterium]|nr:MAG: hypothetical protein EOO00_05070 [Chitinophagaceae bacterium]
MNGPSTYSGWVDVLERFAKGDDTSIAEIEAGSFRVDAGTAYRFYIKVEDAYKKRKQLWLEKFNRSFQIQSIRTINELEIIVRNGKQNLLPLSRFVSAKSLPDDLRKTLQEDLSRFVDEIRKSMKDHLSRSGNDREKMLTIMNAFGLNNQSPADKTADPASVKNGNTNNPPPGRTILF